ncbi:MULTISPECIES: DUF5676 family membrane protein [Pseudoalteromonas]|uniref:Membrane protein n=1 Tax=Pseudoalteromonas piratica TaxID=1348114 RepID=A0A0A7EJB2_9GAMM|nr:DUF5676 family membrane protein [Pseudoalteromonas piratica]AIY66126.1 membrane protein [Pseudoalteromonas piratica]
MKLNEKAFSLACAAAFAIVWSVCSVVVMVMPEMMSNMTSKMLHTDWQIMGWHMSITSAIWGGILWALLAGLIGWLIAKIYNMQSSN